MNTITVDIRNVYGAELVYPVCDKAKLMAKLAGTKTLTRETLAIIQSLGYAVEVKAKEFTS